MKKLLLILFVITSFISYGQSGYITKDTTFLTWNARITYVVGKSDSTNIFININGLGEVGTNPALAAVHGPHLFIAQGWNGGIQLGNGTHYPVYVTLQQPSGYRVPTIVGPVLDAVISRFKVKYGGVNVMGMSNGGWVWETFFYYQPTFPNYSYSAKLRTIVTLEGQRADDNLGADPYPYVNYFGHVAKNSTTKWLGFEQILDGRNIDGMMKNMIDSVGSNNGRFSFLWTNFGAGGHEGFDSMYNPSNTNWTLSNPAVRASNNSAIPSIPIATNQNIYQWALRQDADTSLYGTISVLPSVNAGPKQNLELPINSTTLISNIIGGTAPYTYLWSQVSGATATIVSPTSASTIVTGLSFGSYIFKLTVVDAISGTSNNNVAVNIVYSTTDLSITSNNVSNAGTSVSLLGNTDNNHSITSIKWTKLTDSLYTPKKVVVFGSSTSAGAGSTGYVAGGTNDSSYVGRFRAWSIANGFASTVINIAQSTTDIYNGQPTSYIPPIGRNLPLAGRNITAALALAPDIIIMNYPSNSYDFLSVTETMAGFRRIRDTCILAGVPFYVTTTQPRMGFSPTEKLKLIEFKDSIKLQFPNNYIDFYSPLTDEIDPTLMIPAYNAGDNVHPNDAGHKQIFNRLVEFNIFKSFITSSAVITPTNTYNTTITSIPKGVNKFQVSIVDFRGLAANSISTVSGNSGAVVPPPVTVTCNSATPVTYTQLPTGPNEIYITNAMGKPWRGGDTINIPAGTYTVVEIDSFGGDPCRDIIIRNYGGQVIVNGPMRFGKDMHYVKVLGGLGTGYGFKVTTLASDRINHATFDKIEIGPNPGGVGVYSKMDPDTSRPETMYPNYVNRKNTYNALYIHDVEGEGMYVGNTAPNADPYHGNAIPQRQDSITISNCIVNNTGWDGIQLSNARNGNLIFGNTVTNFGLRDIDAQRTGIISGGNTNSKVYNNTVSNGTGNGMEFFGYGTLEVYGNTITDVGNTATNINGEQSIYGSATLITVETNPKMQMTIHDNLFVRPKVRGAIFFYDNFNNGLPANIYNNIFNIPNALSTWKSTYFTLFPIGYTDINNTLYVASIVPNFEIRSYLLKKQ